MPARFSECFWKSANVLPHLCLGVDSHVTLRKSECVCVVGCVCRSRRLTASATIVCTYEFNADPTAFNADVSSTDLINQGQSTYSSYVGVDEYGGTVGSTLNNGTAVEPFGFAHDPDGTTTETYTLNTSVNTLGYDIAKFYRSLRLMPTRGLGKTMTWRCIMLARPLGVFTPLYSVVNVGIDPDGTDLLDSSNPQSPS